MGLGFWEGSLLTPRGMVRTHQWTRMMLFKRWRGRMAVRGPPAGARVGPDSKPQMEIAERGVGEQWRGDVRGLLFLRARVSDPHVSGPRCSSLGI